MTPWDLWEKVRFRCFLSDFQEITTFFGCTSETGSCRWENVSPNLRFVYCGQSGPARSSCRWRKLWQFDVSIRLDCGQSADLCICDPSGAEKDVTQDSEVQNIVQNKFNLLSIMCVQEWKRTYHIDLIVVKSERLHNKQICQKTQTFRLMCDQFGRFRLVFYWIRFDNPLPSSRPCGTPFLEVNVKKWGTFETLSKSETLTPPPVPLNPAPLQVAEI